MQKPVCLLMLLCCTLLCWQCDPASQSMAAKVYTDEWPSRQELMRTFREQRQLTIVYGTGDPLSAEAYREWATGIAERSRRTRISVQSDTAVSRPDLEEQVLLVVGTPQSNQVAARLAGRLPVQVENNRICFDDYQFDDPTTVFSLAFFPNPYSRRLPLLFLTGRSDPAILAMLHQQDDSGWSLFRWANWGYAAYQQGRRVLLGNFKEDSWTADPDLRFDFTAPPKLVHQTAHFRYWSREQNWSEGSLEELAAASEEQLQRIQSFTGMEVKLDPIDHHLYSSTEQKGLLLNNTDQVQVDLQEEHIHRIFNDIYREKPSGEENVLILRHLLGRPRTSILEKGLAIYFTEQWQGRGYRHWAQRLHKAGGVLSLSTLVNNDSLSEHSRLISGALGASLVEFLIDYWGRDRFLQEYPKWAPGPAERRILERAWSDYLERQEASEIVAAGSDRPLPFLRGFNFTHEGYQIYNGYGSKKARMALKELGKMHVNAASIVPYSGLRDPQSPGFIPVSDRPGSENDEAVIHAVYAARQEGMQTVMKPQIWIGRGSWPGDIEMQNEADWRKFFDYYQRWIAHYAMLSEIHDVDILCIGTELSLTTLQRPDDWRRLIQNIRQLYSGRIAYAANWGQEFEQLSFWDELDIIGINCYYPLSDKPKASKADLQAGFQNIAARIRAVAERENKPLVFTEIGFSSVEAPWILPYSDGYDRPASMEHQRLCYEVVLQTIADSPWCAGIFWWKWPTDLEEEDRREGKGFMPNGKPAAKVVADYYRQLKEQDRKPAR